MPLKPYEERNLLIAASFDALHEAYNRYKREVEGVQVVLRSHGFTETEIQSLIEASRK